MSNQTRVLCVDDELNVLRALARVFFDDDYEILTAASGEEGLELLDAQVQVVISDFRMPGMNGVEFLKEVFKRRPQTIRIVLSGYADTAAVVAAINEGKIYKFIPKPWNDDELRMTVAKALEIFSIQRKNQELAEELRRKNEELSELNRNLELLARQCECEFAVQRRALLHTEKILEQLPFGVLSLDEQGVVRQMNLTAAALLQVDGKEALEKALPGSLPAALLELEREPGDADSLTLEAAGGTLRARVSRWREEGDGGVIVTLNRVCNEG